MKCALPGMYGKPKITDFVSFEESIKDKFINLVQKYKDDKFESKEDFEKTYKKHKKEIDKQMKSNSKESFDIEAYKKKLLAQDSLDNKDSQD